MPFPDPFPNSIYNQGRQLTGGLFLEWGAVPDEKEEALADTIRANYAVSKLNEHHDAPFFLGWGFTFLIFRTIARRSILTFTIPLPLNAPL